MAASKNYKDIDWLRCKSKLIKLQNALAAALREGNYVQVKKLQENFVKSFAVKKVWKQREKYTWSRRHYMEK